MPCHSKDGPNVAIRKFRGSCSFSSATQLLILQLNIVSQASPNQPSTVIACSIRHGKKRSGPFCRLLVCSSNVLTCNKSRVRNLIIVILTLSRVCVIGPFRMAVCILCQTEVPLTKHRRLYSPASGHAQELKVAVTHSGYRNSIIPADLQTAASAELPYMCIKCFSQVERVLKLRADYSKRLK